MSKRIFTIELVEFDPPTCVRKNGLVIHKDDNEDLVLIKDGDSNFEPFTLHFFPESYQHAEENLYLTDDIAQIGITAEITDEMKIEFVKCYNESDSKFIVAEIDIETLEFRFFEYVT
jgi:hypothetical protein